MFYGIGTLSKVVLNIISSYRQHSNIAESNPSPVRPPENTGLGRNCRPSSPHSQSLIAAKASQNAHTIFFSYWKLWHPYKGTTEELSGLPLGYPLKVDCFFTKLS